MERILKENNVDFIVKDQSDEIDFNKNISGVILSGGDPYLDTKILLEQIRGDIASIINLDVPVLGICEGHEIIAEICGGNITKMAKPAKYNNLEVKIIDKSGIFKHLPENIKVYEHHSRLS